MTRSLVSRPALLKLPHASECWRSDEIAAYSIRRSRLALRPFGPAPRGFFSSLPVARDVSRSTILSRNSAFYRVLPVHFAFRPLRKAPLLGFSIPFSAIGVTSYVSRDLTLGYPPTSTVSHRLREPTSGDSFPGLFHPGSTPGVLPSGGSPQT